MTLYITYMTTLFALNLISHLIFCSGFNTQVISGDQNIIETRAWAHFHQNTLATIQQRPGNQPSWCWVLHGQTPVTLTIPLKLCINHRIILMNLTDRSQLKGGRGLAKRGIIAHIADGCGYHSSYSCLFLSAQWMGSSKVAYCTQPSGKDCSQPLSQALNYPLMGRDERRAHWEKPSHL